MKQVRRIIDLCYVCINELFGRVSDIWNFGLIIFYLKSGKYPYIG